MTQEYVNDIADFISRYVTHMLGAGVHTSRVVRNSKRIGEALGTEVRIHTSQKTATLTVCEKGGSTMSTRVLDIPGFPISFEWNADLSALSWAAYDNDMSLEAIRHKFDGLISKPKINPWFVLFMVGLANASFCRLFGGGVWAMLIVFTSTLVGFFTRQHLTRRGVNHYIVFIVSAFVASLCASSALSLGIESAEIALATSVLYLVPGVPLINGVIDITDGHIQIGISRLVNALMLIVCIAIGMSGTLMLVKDSLL
ncbi:MAG: threonine/serine exporter family protein [Bacteroidetes bacterium]|uniref:Threonine/serine exporter family protein n=1 Tax=Candidatus Cryptobacteroides faecavium TaxID=2840762 RepID=A0A9D9IFD9_9BACT|nr:threonine/serine exporter family protein [Candidatus Cryptobacteroides faecavium]